MNFLRTTTFRDNWYALTAEKRSEITAANVAYHEKYIKAGKLKDVWTFVDGRLMSIWDVGSLAELATIVMESPYYPFVISETAPFLDHHDVVKLLAERREAVKK